MASGEVELGGTGGSVGGDLGDGAVEATLDVRRVTGGWLGEVFAQLVSELAVNLGGEEVVEGDVCFGHGWYVVSGSDQSMLVWMIQIGEQVYSRGRRKGSSWLAGVEIVSTYRGQHSIFMVGL